MKHERVKCASLKPDPKNARKHSKKNLDAIKKSLGRFGQQKPIVVSASGVVLAGNGTLEAAIALGWEEIEVTRSALKGASATAYALADNRTAELADWDDDILAEALEALRVEDESLALATGFGANELATITGGNVGMTDPDEIPEPPAEPITKSGDLWLLGAHRVLCGDSTKAEDVARLLDKKTPTLMITDPPYGINYDGGATNKSKREKIINDNNTGCYGAALAIAAKAMPNGAWYVWHDTRKVVDVFLAIKDSLFQVRAVCVWNKLNAGYGAPNANYCVKFEPVVYAVRGSCGFIGATTETTVWDIEQPHRNKLHPTQKPVECMARPLRNHDAPLVYDPFLGSGTTLIAAEQLGRKCYGMEISPQYCDVIVKRWEEFTGKTATLESRE